MTDHNAKIRWATTAIAAVLVLSSTPLFAQDVPAPNPAPELVTEPVTPAPDPLAPERAAAESAPATETAPSAKASNPAAKATVAAAGPAPISRTTLTRSSAATTTVTAAAAAPATPPAIEATAATPLEAARAPAPAPADTGSLAEARQTDRLLEVGGAGLLALLLGGMALRSRKRRKEEERIEEAKWAYIEDHPEPEAVREPSFAPTIAPMHDPVPAASKAPVAGAPVTKLPRGFDLSRFGPHVQAAYRGPTPDNPSLSLRYRLRRASALDQQERLAGETAPRPAAPVPAKPIWATREEPQFMLRRAEMNNGAKPAFQR